MEEKIINAALALFENSGIKFTLDEIANRENISKKTIYKYFKNKEELMEKAVDFVFEDIENQHFLIISSNIPLLDKLKNVLCVYPRVFNVTDENSSKIISLYPSIYKLMIVHFNEKWDTTLDLLHQCIDEKLIKPISDNTFKIIMVGIFDNVFHYPDQKKELQKCIEAVFDGIVERKKQNDGR